MTQLDDTMLRLLRDAGILAGMKVLDAGCGTGRLAQVLAELVGPQGQVVGVDQTPDALAAARKRMAELGQHNVQFIEGDLQKLPSDLNEFDAIVGRRVLMYIADRHAALSSLASALRPGGLLVLQEVDNSMVPASLAELPLHRQVHDWIWSTVLSEGATPSVGFELAGLIESAGLKLAEIRAEAIVQTSQQRHHVATIVRAIMSRIVERGIVTEAEIDIETLDQRLLQELANSGATYIGDMVFGAWAHKPG